MVREKMTEAEWLTFLDNLNERINHLKVYEPVHFLKLRLRLYRAVWGDEVRIPVSMLKELALQEYLEDFGGGDETELSEEEFHWSEALYECGIPLFQQWGSGDTVPLKVRRQLVGQVARAGLKITYRGVECVAVQTDLPANMIGQTITEVPDLDYLFLAEARYFDFEH